jgi:ABC-type methionine transport system ATPase subunit
VGLPGVTVDSVIRALHLALVVLRVECWELREAQYIAALIQLPAPLSILNTQPAMDDQQRLWLMFPTRLVTQPIIWELAQKFKVVTNIRQASVTDEVGVVSLSLRGEREEIKKAIAWLEGLGVKVEPVEIQTIEG